MHKMAWENSQINVLWEKPNWSREYLRALFSLKFQWIINILSKCEIFSSRKGGKKVWIKITLNWEFLWHGELRIQLVSMSMWVQSLALISGLAIRHCRSCGVGRRDSSDSALLWLWGRPVAAALTQLWAWELLHAIGVALK